MALGDRMAYVHVPLDGMGGEDMEAKVARFVRALSDQGWQVVVTTNMMTREFEVEAYEEKD